MKPRALILAASLLAAAPANAVILGTSPSEFSPDVFLTSPTGTVLATVGPSPFVSSGGVGDFSGIYSVTAISDPSNVFGAGDVTLLYNFRATTGLNDIGRVTVSDFGAFPFVDAGFVVGPGRTPNTVDRTSLGPVGFNYFAGVGSGFASDELVVETPGRTVVPGVFALINDQTSDNPSLAAGAIPEASTWAMMIAGFLLLGTLARRRRAISVA